MSNRGVLKKKKNLLSKNINTKEICKIKFIKWVIEKIKK